MVPKNLILLALILLCTAKLVHLKPNAKPDDPIDENDYDEFANDAQASDEEEDEDYAYDNNDNPSPDSGNGITKILSSPQKLISVAGENVHFDCEVEDSGDLIVKQWFHNDKLIYQDDLFALNIKLKSHYRKPSNGSLIILNVSEADAGEYECKIKSTIDLAVKHNLKVKSPPKITRLLPMDPYTANLSQPLNLFCEATGVPPPKVTWSKHGTRFPTDTEQFYNSTFTFEKLTLHDAGTYQCMADNNIGNPAIAQITIRIRQKPEVRIEKSSISSEKDYTSILTCIAHGHPTPITEWFHNNKRIDPNNGKFNVTEKGHYYTLYISNTQESDFGKYVCESRNPMGITRKEVELTGVPVPIEIKVRTNGYQPTYYWSFQSIAPITDYEIQSKAFEDKHFSPVLIPYEVQSSTGSQHNAYLKDSPKPTTGHYQVRIKAKNTYGWSEFSDIADFSISGDFSDFSLTEPVPENISESSATHLSISIVLFIGSLLLIRLD